MFPKPSTNTFKKDCPESFESSFFADSGQLLFDAVRCGFKMP